MFEIFIFQFYPIIVEDNNQKSEAKEIKEKTPPI